MSMERWRLKPPQLSPAASYWALLDVLTGCCGLTHPASHSCLCVSHCPCILLSDIIIYLYQLVQPPSTRLFLIITVISTQACWHCGCWNLHCWLHWCNEQSERHHLPLSPVKMRMSLRGGRRGEQAVTCRQKIRERWRRLALDWEFKGLFLSQASTQGKSIHLFMQGYGTGANPSSVRVGYTLDRSPVHHRADTLTHSHSHSHLQAI